MDSEETIIRGILQNFPKSVEHQNEFYESDSEILRISADKLLLSIDTYTEEDNFRLNNPLILGYNLAVCTMSDIFACGGKPKFFGNSLSCSKSWDSEFINQLSKGVAKALQECNCGFIGGDFGYLDKWSYTGVVLGTADKIISRKGAAVGDYIYITGSVGAGNFEAASQLKSITSGLDDLFEKYPIIFNSKVKEAQLISKFAECCIDTSDGLFDSLKRIAELNNIGFEIKDIPYFQPGLILTNYLSLPKELLAFGECGEYELLFTVKREKENELLIESEEQKINIHKIGTIKSGNSLDFHTGGIWINTNDLNLSARDFNDHYSYLNELTVYLKSKLGLL